MKRTVVVTMAALLMTAGSWVADQGTATAKKVKIKAEISSPANKSTLGSPVSITVTVTDGTSPYTYEWKLKKGTPGAVTMTTAVTTNTVVVKYPPPANTQPESPCGTVTGNTIRPRSSSRYRRHLRIRRNRSTPQAPTGPRSPAHR